MPAGRSVAGAALAAVAWLAIGCSTPGGPATLAEARADYNAGRYTAALAGAERVARAEDPTLSDEGTYLAGLAASRAGDDRKAERYLNRAAQSADSALAADAAAELGLLYRAQGNQSAAVRAFERAARGLTGNDRAQALFYAAVAQQRLGRWTQARTNLLAARAAAADPALRARIADQLNITGYTVQVGAFSDRTNARRTALELAPAIRDVRLPPPVLARGVDRLGRPLTLVQVGQFATFSAAVRARNRLDLPGAFIVPLATR
ncbi:MAG: SPOR domain-containing protein [Planctomycetota bacterium]